MGTNYYLNIDPCKHCHRPAEQVHIGKSSHGWRFLFAKQPEWSTMKELMANATAHELVNEYGEVIMWEDFFKLVGRKQSAKTHKEFMGCHNSSTDTEGYEFYVGEFS